MEEFIENYAQIPQSKRILYALIAGVVIVVLFSDWGSQRRTRTLRAYAKSSDQT